MNYSTLNEPRHANPNGQTVMAALVILLVLAAFDQTMVATALPQITVDVGGRDRASWVFSTYLIASAAVIPLYGRLADVLGRRRVLLAAVSLFGVGSVLCGSSQTMQQLLVARLLQGLGGGGLLTLTMLAVSDVASGNRIARYHGLLGTVYGLAAVLGAPVGGVITEWVSWRWAFLVNAPLALLALYLLATRYRPLSRSENAKFDFIGAGLLVGAIASLLITSRVAATDFRTPEMWVGWAALFLGLSAGFVKSQLVAGAPIVPPHFLKNRTLVGAILLSAFSGAGLFAAVVFAPLYFQYGQGDGSAATGAKMVLLMGGVLLGSTLSGRIMFRLSRVRVLAVSGSLLTTAAFAASAIALHIQSKSMLQVSLAAVGVGIGTALPIITINAQRAVEPRHIGIATALPVMARTLGGAIALTVLGALLSATLHSQGLTLGTAEGLSEGFSAAVQQIFAVSAAIALVGAVTALCLPSALPTPNYPSAPRS